ncbi:MAG: bifunctional 3-(3-hydroxy-phenyl)propionate/3-hydroxycinnamic acid hydroxylase [Pseudomonadota bacterium]
MKDLFDVAIVGAGPVGTLLAILLGQKDKRVALIEKWPTQYDRPRAVTMDHEVARILATLGIDSDNDPLIEYHDELYYWKNADLEDIQIVDWKSVSPSGWRVTYWFNQPELETRLLNIASEIPSITIMRGWEATDLNQSDSAVSLSLRQTPQTAGKDALNQTATAQYVVGCDGANSFVRDRLGIKNIDKGYFFDWLILDMIPKEDYTVSPAQWQLCDPKRPTTIVPGGPGRRRWEFMVLPGESSQDIAKAENAWKLMKPWGLTPQNAELERSAVYRFQARWAERWCVGRCMIAGDAAHLMPPFAGAGMCTGLRDAVALGWRLNAILDGTMGDGVLGSYESERLHHARHYIDFSQELGNIICIADPKEAADRDKRMKAELTARNYEPASGHQVQLGAGAWLEGTQGAGELSMQGFVSFDGQQGRFDQVVGTGWKVIGYDRDPEQFLDKQAGAILRTLDAQTVAMGPTHSDFPVIDVNDSYCQWMKSIDAAFVILRPDFYIAATARDDAELCSHIKLLAQKLYLSTA